MQDRRDFLKAGAAATAGLAMVNSAFAAGTDVIKVGVIGCGGRGSGAAENILTADDKKSVKIVALGDAFKNRTDGLRKRLTERFADRTDLPEDRCFVGLDAYERVINAGVDLVILATPPGFRPQHLQAAVAAGKHIFTEKPVCVDGAGARKCLDVYEESKKKGLAIVAGTQRRHQLGYVETMKRIHDGAIGDVVNARAYWNGGGIWFRKREPGMSDVAYQIHNWYHFLWLCGDHIVEQHVHNLDVVNWALKSPPVKAVGTGSRIRRPEGDPNEVGHIYDNFAIDFEYPGGVHVFSMCRHIPGAKENISEALVGTKGVCIPNAYTINGKKVLDRAGDQKARDPYVQEHIDLLASIRDGKPLNELKNVTESSLTAVLGRTAAYTGREVTFQELLGGQDDTFPKNLAWDMSLPVGPVPVPGTPEGERKKRAKA